MYMTPHDTLRSFDKFIEYVHALEEENKGLNSQLKVALYKLGGKVHYNYSTIQMVEDMRHVIYWEHNDELGTDRTMELKDI